MRDRSLSLALTPTALAGAILGAALAASAAPLGAQSARASDPTAIRGALAKSGLADPTRPWVATYGTTQVEQVFDVVSVAPDGFQVLASADTVGLFAPDAWFVRLNRLGTVLQEFTLGGPGHDELVSLVETQDGGFLAAGATTSFGAGGTDGWVVKLDANGAVEWQRAYGGGGEEEFTAIAVSPDGAYVGGRMVDDVTGTDPWVLELNFAGEILWQERFAGASEDFLSTLTATSDGLAFVANSSSDLGGFPVAFHRPWLVKLDGAGAVQWQRVYDYSSGDLWNHLVALDTGGFVVTGEILAAAFFRGDAWVVRLDDLGGVLWDRRLGDHLGVPGFDGGRRVLPTSDGGFAVAAGTSTGGGGGEKLWLIRLDSQGALVWNRRLGGNMFDFATALAPGANGFLLAGASSSFGRGSQDALALQLTASGMLGDSCNLQHPTGPNVWSDTLSTGTPAVAPTPTAAGSIATAGTLGALGVNASFVCVRR